MNDLTVITLHLPYRADRLERLREEIAGQVYDAGGTSRVQHLIFTDTSLTYGECMRKSLERSTGRYVCWLDDDDWPMPRYVGAILEGIDTGADVVTFGSYTPGCVPAWLYFGKTDNCGRDPLDNGNIKSANHYCAWSRPYALAVPWLPRYYGAEYAWYTGLRLAFPSLVEHHVHEVLHEYRYDASDTKCQNREAIGKSIGQGARVLLLFRGTDGNVLMAVGNNQPSGGYYRAYTPGGHTERVSEDDVKVLYEITYR
jgi:glycosyltransferase involved in cell wall biosynthesis